MVLKIAIQKSGRLHDDSIGLLRDCGIHVKDARNGLKSVADNFPLEAYFLRDDDIPQYVEDGVAHAGIVGENVLYEKERSVQVVESLGFKLVIVDGRKTSEESITNLEIFTKLHRSNVVIADMTGERPNNFIELGYALRGDSRVLVTARQGSNRPFDTDAIPCHIWQDDLRALWV